MAKNETWVTQDGKAPRKVTDPDDLRRAIRAGADPLLVKSKPVKIKVRRKDAKETKAAETAKKEGK